MTIQRCFLITCILIAASGCGGSAGEDESDACVTQCGDGICQEVVCLSLGCPCAETSTSCPLDCPLT